jgi:thiosulfate dehydrogenase
MSDTVLRARAVSFSSVVLSAIVLAGCGPVAAREYGAQLFSDPTLTRSAFNSFSCATCHAVNGEGPAIPAGYDLAGSAFRQRFWGGASTTLLDAVNHCVTFYMRGAALDRDDVKGRALYEYLVSISPDRDTPALPLTVVENVRGLGRGPVERGRAVWDGACRFCHGEPNTGEGRINELSGIVPNDAAEFAAAAGFPVDVVVVEKIRHGSFFGVGGTMPLFSLEALNDDDVAALLAFLDL